MLQVDSCKNYFYIIAPHDLKLVKQIAKKLEALQISFNYFTKNEVKTESNILILDTIGHLSRLYRYAHYAFVGGGFSGSLHNILEPASYYLPIACGPSTLKFEEAQAMEKNGTLTKVKTSDELIKNIEKTMLASSTTSELQKKFMEANSGATLKAINHIEKNQIL
jgi:3-deoxy-D-manno-octulosonic-acid transferase